MPYFPSSSCEMESSSSLRHCVTTARSLLRISWSISLRGLLLQGRRFVTKVCESRSNEFIEAKAHHAHRVHGLACPCVADFLGRSIRLFLFAVGTVHDVIPSIDGVIDSLL